MSSFVAGEPLAVDLKSPLADPQPRRNLLPSRWLLLAGLLLIAFLPRALMAWRTDVICEDGPVYIAAARFLEQGNLDLGFRVSNLGLNIYPLILLQLHRLGLDWFLAGKLWSVLMSTLVVLPLFGWTRRQLSEPVAVAACLLYACHPTLIERGPEVLRCPTFWLLVLLTLYLLWRAVTEVRLATFLAAGISMALAVHTRAEAWFVMAPWTLWCAWRFIGLHSDRARLVCGSVLGLAIIPLFVVAVNLTWLKDHPQWESCFSGRLAMLRALYQLPPIITQPAPWQGGSDAKPETGSQPAMPVLEQAPLAVVQPVVPPAVAPEPSPSVTSPSVAMSLPPLTTGVMPSASGGAPAVAAPITPPVVLAAPPGWNRLFWSYLQKLVDAFNPVFGLLTIIGLATHWRLFLRRDQQATFYMCLLNFAAIGLFLWKAHEVVGRYFFPVVLLSTPYAALGMFRTVAACVSLAQCRWRAAAERPELIFAGAFLVVAALGWTDALTNDFTSRRQRQELGQWIERRMGSPQLIVGTEPRAMTLAFYANGFYVGPTPHEQNPAGFEQLCRRWSPGLIMVWNSSSERKRMPWLVQYQVDQLLLRDYLPIDPLELPAACRHVQLFVRRDVALAAQAAVQRR